MKAIQPSKHSKCQKMLKMLKIILTRKVGKISVAPEIVVLDLHYFLYRLKINFPWTLV